MYGTAASPGGATLWEKMRSPREAMHSATRKLAHARADLTARGSADSWQRRLDKALLDVDASPEARVQLLQGALGPRSTATRHVM